MNKIDLEKDVNCGFSLLELAKKYNKGQSTIRYWLKNFGLKTKQLAIGNGYVNPNLERYKREGTIFKKLDWNRCQKLNDDGTTWRDLIVMGFSSAGMLWAIKNGKLKLRSIGNSLKIAHKNGKIDYSPYRTPEHRKIMSKFGGIKPNSGRCKHIKYTKKDGIVVDLQGSWELKFVEFLDEHQIEWQRNRVGYKYTFQNKEHLYFPDFHLHQYDVYVEVKGYETDKDKAKWNQFPFKLLVVKKQEIQNLTAWWKLKF